MGYYGTSPFVYTSALESVKREPASLPLALCLLCWESLRPMSHTSVGSEHGQKTGVRKGLASLKKLFHFFQELICLPISTAHELSMILQRSVFNQEGRTASIAPLPSVRLLFVLVELGPPGVAQAPAHSPEQGPAPQLGTFLDLDDLSCH
jgi:hypothetical protein